MEKILFGTPRCIDFSPGPADVHYVKWMLNIAHLFFHSSYTHEDWCHLFLLVDLPFIWTGVDIQLAWYSWTSCIHFSTSVALPVFAIWGIWLARNRKIFDDILILAQVYARRSFGIFEAFLVLASILPVIFIKDPIVDVSSPWAFVDGTSQGRPQIGGAGGILHLNYAQSFHFSAGLGDGTNNYAEFATIIFLWKLSFSLGVDRLQIIGDSKLTTDCLKLGKPHRDIFLLPIYEYIERTCLLF